MAFTAIIDQRTANLIKQSNMNHDALIRDGYVTYCHPSKALEVEVRLATEEGESHSVTITACDSALYFKARDLEGAMLLLQGCQMLDPDYCDVD